MGGSQPTLPLHDEDHHYHEDEDEAQSGLVQISGHTGDTEAPGVWQQMRSRFIQPSNVIFLRI